MRCSLIDSRVWFYWQESVCLPGEGRECRIPSMLWSSKETCYTMGGNGRSYRWCPGKTGSLLGAWEHKDLSRDLERGPTVGSTHWIYKPPLMCFTCESFKECQTPQNNDSWLGVLASVQRKYFSLNTVSQDLQIFTGLMSLCEMLRYIDTCPKRANMTGCDGRQRMRGQRIHLMVFSEN